MSVKNYYSVLSGELADRNKITSEQLGKIPDIIRASFQEVNKRKEKKDRLVFEIIRMDEFLALAETPETALHALLMLATRFRHRVFNELGIRAELRISLGAGPIEYAQKELRESNGTAFRLAQAGLGAMKKNHRLSVTTTEKTVNEEMKVHCSFMNILMRNWSDEQAEALFYSLSGLNQMKISEHLQISQPAVNRRLKSANWEPVEQLINRYRSLMKTP